MLAAGGTFSLGRLSKIILSSALLLKFAV